MTCILLIDDEIIFARSLRHSLVLNGYQCLIAYTGEEALELLDSHQIDLVLLDLGLPSMSGLTVCKRMRTRSFELPIIVVSADDQDEDIVKALNLGADDYVTKPFNPDVLLARIGVQLRHANPPVQLFIAGPLSIDFTQKIVQLNGEDVSLTHIEYKLLEVLARNKGKIVPMSMLLSKVWGDSHSNEHQFIHVYVNRLRKKIEPDPAHPRFIRNDRGIGYRFMMSD